jgi:hypothetical protein
VIEIFVKIREYALTHKEILLQLAKLEKETKGNSKDIENIFAVLKELIEKQSKPTPQKPHRLQALRLNNSPLHSAHALCNLRGHYTIDRPNFRPN